MRLIVYIGPTAAPSARAARRLPRLRRSRQPPIPLSPRSRRRRHPRRASIPLTAPSPRPAPLGNDNSLLDFAVGVFKNPRAIEALNGHAAMVGFTAAAASFTLSIHSHHAKQATSSHLNPPPSTLETGLLLALEGGKTFIAIIRCATKHCLLKTPQARGCHHSKVAQYLVAVHGCMHAAALEQIRLL